MASERVRIRGRSGLEVTGHTVDVDPTRSIVTPMAASRKPTTSSVRARRYKVALITKNLVESVCPKMR